MCKFCNIDKETASDSIISTQDADVSLYKNTEGEMYLVLADNEDVKEHIIKCCPVCGRE